MQKHGGRTLIEHLISKQVLSTSQQQIYDAVLCFRADALCSSRMQFRVSDCSFTGHILNTHQRGYSAVWLLHGTTCQPQNINSPRLLIARTSVSYFSFRCRRRCITKTHISITQAHENGEVWSHSWGDICRKDVNVKNQMFQSTLIQHKHYLPPLPPNMFIT